MDLAQAFNILKAAATVIAPLLIYILGQGALAKLSSLPPAQKKGLRWLVIAISVSIFLVSSAYMALSSLTRANTEITADRALSFTDSVFAGIVGFVLLGAFTFIASLRKPDEESISDRISYLYSARLDENKNAREYITGQLLTLGATIRESETTYRFTEIDEANKCMKVNTLVSMTIINMMKHDTYRQKMPISISFDKIVGHEIIAGRILRIETTQIQSDFTHSASTSHLNQPTSIPAKPEKYSGEVLLEIPANGELKYCYEYEGWVNIADNFWTGVNRFAHKQSVHAVNLTSKTINFKKNRTPHERKKFIDINSDFTSAPGEGKLIHCEQGVEPGCPITFTAEAVLCSPPSQVEAGQ